jgi:ubiquitin-conjugating enzyme E2 G2
LPAIVSHYLVLGEHLHRIVVIFSMAANVASKRLFQEYKSLLTNPPDGITAGPVNEDDLFIWEALIQGPEGTPFEGGIFPAELKFPKDYPLNPPKMKFLGEIWHPNGTDCALLLRTENMALTYRSVRQWRGVYLDPPSSRRRSKSL